MKITVERFDETENSTLSKLSIDGEFFCYCLEDGEREVKEAGVTRIPAGTYKVDVRDAGGLTKKYKKKFECMHKGMLWLRDVPNFKWVYIHVGNRVKHSDGCILVGSTNWSDECTGNLCVGNSTKTYKMFYEKVIQEALAGDLTIEIKR